MRTQYKPLPRALPALRVPVLVPSGVRVLWCDVCGAWMPHALNKSQTLYVCSCGTELIYIPNQKG